MRRDNGALQRTFALPALIAAASLVGLASALIGDGPYDALSWLGLGAPVVAFAWALALRRK